MKLEAQPVLESVAAIRPLRASTALPILTPGSGFLNGREGWQTSLFLRSRLVYFLLFLVDHTITGYSLAAEPPRHVRNRYLSPSLARIKAVLATPLVCFLPTKSVETAKFTPITGIESLVKIVDSILTNGFPIVTRPPDAPGLTEASVWMKSPCG